MNTAKIKTQKSAFIGACNLVQSMQEYSKSLSKYDANMLEFFTMTYKEMPLPSGRVGNAIALALEINNYISAEYLIANAKKLNIKTNAVARDKTSGKEWSLHDEYLFSQLTYDPNAVAKEKRIYYATEEDFNEYILHLKRNKLANESLEKLLSTPRENKKVFQLKNN